MANYEAIAYRLVRGRLRRRKKSFRASWHQQALDIAEKLFKGDLLIKRGHLRVVKTRKIIYSYYSVDP